MPEEYLKFHHYSKHIPYISPDSSSWPRSWIDINYKTYPKAKTIDLSFASDSNLDVNLGLVLESRKSELKFSQGDTLTLEDLRIQFKKVKF